MNKKITKVLAFLMAALTASSLASCSQNQDFTAGMSEEEKAAWEAAASDPYGKYPELVTYTTGYNLTAQGSDVLAGTPYANDTTENNAYTRYLKEVLNVQNENAFEAVSGADYDQKVSMAIASQDIPDIPGMGTGILRRRNLPLLPAIGTDVLIAQIQAVWASLLLHASGLLSSASAPFRTLWVGPGRKCLFLIILYLSHSCKIFARFPAYFLSRNSALFRANSCIGKTKSLRKIHSEGLCFVGKISELLLLPASF